MVSEEEISFLKANTNEYFERALSQERNHDPFGAAAMLFYYRSNLDHRQAVIDQVKEKMMAFDAEVNTYFSSSSISPGKAKVTYVCGAGTVINPDETEDKIISVSLRMLIGQKNFDLHLTGKLNADNQVIEMIEPSGITPFDRASGAPH